MHTGQTSSAAMGMDLAQSKNETKERQKVMACRGGRNLCRYIDFFHVYIVACVPSLIRISASWGGVQSIQELVQQRDAVMRQNEAVTFKNNKQEQLLTELNRELHNGLVKANTAIDVCVETILVSLNSSQEIVLVASGQAVQERQRKDLQIKQLENLRVADAQQFSDGKRAAVSELEDKHKQRMEAARKKSAKALEAEFGRGRKVGEADESSKNEAKSKEDDKKAHDHQQEIAKQAAKERKEDQERKEDEHKTEVDKLKREKRDMAAAADVAREKLAQVESKVETLSQEKVLSSFVSARYSITPAPVLTDSVLFGG